MQDIFHNFGIYLHVPFCAGNCGYCRFYKRAPSALSFDEYAEAVEREIALAKAEFGALPKPETMYWGGGTPSILPEKTMARLARAFGDLLPSREWTVEVAPSSATRRRLAALKDAGVTRISMGVQSFDERTLKRLGRRHSLKATLAAIDTVSQIGFEHFSIDLIFGAEGQTPDEWLADMERAAKCPVDHISAYCLEFESATSCCAGRPPNKDCEKSEREGDFLELAMSRLPELGFERYEISNYAKSPESRCLHNLSVWHMARWLGFGPAAASQFGGKRFANVADFDKWLAAVRAGKPERVDVVPLDDETLFADALIFGLRMAEGVNLRTLRARFPNARCEKYLRTIGELKSGGLLEADGDTVRLTPRGTLVADAVAVELL